jgi:hypothetical protein
MMGIGAGPRPGSRMKWTGVPPTAMRYWPKLFSCFSAARQSNPSAQYSASGRTQAVLSP